MSFCTSFPEDQAPKVYETEKQRCLGDKFSIRVYLSGVLGEATSSRENEEPGQATRAQKV